MTSQGGSTPSGLLFDSTAFPHLLDKVVQHSERSLLHAFRGTCKRLKDMADSILGHHIILQEIEKDPQWPDAHCFLLVDSQGSRLAQLQGCIALQKWSSNDAQGEPQSVPFDMPLATVRTFEYADDYIWPLGILRTLPCPNLRTMRVYHNYRQGSALWPVCTVQPSVNLIVVFGSISPAMPFPLGSFSSSVQSLKLVVHPWPDSFETRGQPLPQAAYVWPIDTTLVIVLSRLIDATPDDHHRTQSRFYNILAQLRELIRAAHKGTKPPTSITVVDFEEALQSLFDTNLILQLDPSPSQPPTIEQLLDPEFWGLDTSEMLDEDDNETPEGSFPRSLSHLSNLYRSGGFNIASAEDYCASLGSGAQAELELTPNPLFQSHMKEPGSYSM
ncbi:uncharacterized protein LOC62_03G003658 [Vanrija pseudolonga]|uniref:Uncharacterized protein n=1 Tax=Vanrija pseudolonga TaxID=143232 RepID=A0AAF1BJQ7_9TREE|nr:hypothetical protein LOC62_03G003658 [Vanrija pseudolonga]